MHLVLPRTARDAQLRIAYRCGDGVRAATRSDSDGLAADDFVLVEWTAEVGTHWIAPLHVHHADDEAWYVLEGELGFRLGDEEVVAAAGSAVVAPPRHAPHLLERGRRRGPLSPRDDPEDRDA